MKGRDRRQCSEPGCETHFVPKSIRNRFCLRHRKTKPVDREQRPIRNGASPASQAVGPLALRGWTSTVRGAPSSSTLVTSWPRRSRRADGLLRARARSLQPGDEPPWGGWGDWPGVEDLV